MRLATRGSGEGISRERLFSMAAELGISADEVADAEKLVQAQRTELRDRAEFNRSRQDAFVHHLATYVIVNASLVGMNFVTDHRLTWAIWSILGWGIGIATHLFETFLKSGDAYEKEFQKWRLNRQPGAPTPLRAPQITVGVHTGGTGLVNRADLSHRVESLVLIDNPTKIEAIRRVRETTGASLKDAKDAVDAFDRQNPGVIRR